MKKVALILLCMCCIQVFLALRPDLPFTILASRTTLNYPRKKVVIRVWIDNNAPMGIAARFKSNVLISSLAINSSGKEHTTNHYDYKAGVYDGFIYLNSPTFHDADDFIFNFYMPGLSKIVWKTAIQRNK
jgi:hypothetical protein